MEEKYEIVIDNWEYKDHPEYNPSRYSIPEDARNEKPNLIMGMARGTRVETKFGPKYLFRVKRKNGGLGGWIEHSWNLSQSGDCWIYPDAIVCGSAMVVGNAQVKGGQIGGGAIIGGEAEVSGDSYISDGSAIYGKVKDSRVMKFVPERDDRKVSPSQQAEESSVEESELTVHVQDLDEWQAEERITVYESGEVTNGSVILDSAKIYGNVDGSVVGGDSSIYGEVSGGAVVLGDSTVIDGGRVSGKVLVVDGKIGSECSLT